MLADPRTSTYDFHRACSRTCFAARIAATLTAWNLLQLPMPIKLHMICFCFCNFYVTLRTCIGIFVLLIRGTVRHFIAVVFIGMKSYIPFTWLHFATNSYSVNHNFFMIKTPEIELYFSYQYFNLVTVIFILLSCI